MRIHELKTYPGPFAEVVRGDKTFEYRKNDRGYEVGDLLVLREWDGQRFGQGLVVKKVTSILRGGEYGVLNSYCVMSLGEPHGAEQRVHVPLDGELSFRGDWLRRDPASEPNPAWLSVGQRVRVLSGAAEVYVADDALGSVGVVEDAPDYVVTVRVQGIPWSIPVKHLEPAEARAEEETAP